MRARLARPRRIVRGRLVAPVAAAAAVALVAGVVVAAPDSPTVRGDVQTVATTITVGDTGEQFSFNFAGALGAAGQAGIQITEITGLPDGLTYANGVISGTAAAGTYNVTVVGTQDAGSVSTPVSIPVTVTINNADGTPPPGVDGVVGAGGQGQVAAELTTGSDGTDAILGAVVSIVTSLGGEAAADFVTGSVGGGQPVPDNSGQPASAPFGSDANGQLNLGSLGNGTPNGTPDDNGQNPAPDTGSGSSGNAEAGADGTAGLNTDSLGPLGSLIDTTTEGDTNPTGSTTGGDTTTGGTANGEFTIGGNLPAAAQVEIPGSSSPVDTGSLGNLAPGLAFTGAALLGLAGLGLALSGGSSTPGSTAFLPALPGSTTTGGTTTGGGSSNNPSTGGSSGSTAPTVAAGAPRQVQAPGPTVANGRG